MQHSVSRLDIVGDKELCLLKRGVGGLGGSRSSGKPCNPTLGDSGISQKSAVSIHRPYGNEAVKHHRLNPGKWEERREDRGGQE